MDIHDLVGIGFGPSHIGLAVALYEDYKDETSNKKIAFFEAKAKHGWHHPMMLPDAKMQISFMKDLCFLRNPKSHFTFVNYLHEHRRLSSFANLRDFNPSRKEFDDYLRWVAGHFSHITSYSSCVQSVVPVIEGADVTCLDVEIRDTRTQEVRTVRTRNLAVAIGGEQAMPVACINEHVFHSSRLLERLPDYDESKPHRFLVVGSGQSAAEIYRHLVSHYREADVRVASSGIGFKQADDSEYINEVFDNDMIDRIYQLDPVSREQLIRKHFDTNYSVADLSIIQSLYREEYEATIAGDTPRFGVLKFKRLAAVVEHNGSLLATLTSTLDNEIVELEVDVVICATGYSRKNNLALLDNLKPYWVGQSDMPILSRNYALQTTDNFRPTIFVQGMSESTHGLSDTLLSVISRRSHEVGQAIVQRCCDQDVQGWS